MTKYTYTIQVISSKLEPSEDIGKKFIIKIRNLNSKLQPEIITSEITETPKEMKIYTTLDRRNCKNFKHHKS